MREEEVTTRRALTMTLAIVGIVLLASILPVVVIIASDALDGRPLVELVHAWLIDSLGWFIMCQAEALVITFLFVIWIISYPKWSTLTKAIAIGVVLVCHTFVAWVCIVVRGDGGW